MTRIGRNISEDQAVWRPYPTHRDPRPSYLSQFFDESCNLSTIARDISWSMFADNRASNMFGGVKRASREQLYERIRRWHDLLPEAFDVRYKLPPHIILMLMRYHTLIISLFTCTSDEEVSSTTSDAPHTPESPQQHTPETRYNLWEVTQNAARGIAGLTRLHRREYGVSRAHHFAMYAMNLGLFTMMEQESFDVLDQDFLSLASAFSIVASRSSLGRNLFHIFRQSVRAKAQGSKIRESSSIPDELKDLFDEESSAQGHSRFDEYAEGLEKLNQHEKYHGIGGEGEQSLQDYPGLGLSDMLDRYESLSLGKDEVLAERQRPAGPLHEPIILIAVSVPRDTGLPPGGGRGGSPNLAWNKVAIPRAPNATTISHRRRSQRACEPCRQRKIKCDGNRPSCRQCIEHNQQCSYEDVKRVRDQKRLGSLSRRVDRYESLLRELEVDADATTARKIRKVLKQGPDTALSNQKEEDDDSSSMGSLDGIDILEEDLNRNENSRATGFIGKASEVAWMRKLADDIEHKGVTEASVFKGIDDEQQTSISKVNYHLDDLDIPFVDPSDPSVVPSRDLADRYLEAYFTFVHPTFNIIRKPRFEHQYHEFFDRGYIPHRNWMALLNMILAIGCRYTRFTDTSHAQEDDFLFLTRARKLGLHSHVLFEHSDLHQIQLELLVAVYLLCLGQLNRYLLSFYCVYKR
ncbi:C6 transcription factor [Penicillium riverlandense]|uniref:C6 transcription factor n=1 Tax=Penicillium riverlandense TaxID=1903569 RepID=UPI00254706E1|nr:C6 transcription factor [Penicillium riverlandense]KAJ5806806.1 C6 transcription factor [Penicillium riverlandense]